METQNSATATAAVQSHYCNHCAAFTVVRKRVASIGSIWQAVCWFNGLAFQVFLRLWPCLNSSASVEYLTRTIKKNTEFNGLSSLVFRDNSYLPH